MARNAITTPIDPALATVAGTSDPKALARIAKALEKAKAREAAKAEKKAQRAAEKLLKNKDAIEARAKKRAEREAARAEKKEAKAKEKQAKDEARKAKVAAREREVERELFFRALATHAGADEDRPSLMAIKVDARFGYATDGHRLLKLPTPEGVPAGMYVPIDEKADERSGEERRAEIATLPAFAGWRIEPEWAFQFPAVEQVIPAEPERERASFEITRPEVLGALLSRTGEAGVRFTLGDRHEGAPIRASFGLKPPIGETVYVSVVREGDEPVAKVIDDMPKDTRDFGFQTRYLYDAAKALGLLTARKPTKPEKKEAKKKNLAAVPVRLEPFKVHAFVDASSPVVLHARTTTEDGRRGLAVVMPMRV